MADNPLNAVNRGVYISDNLPFLKSLNDECIDLVCIDPPFAKNETFGRKNSKSPDPLKPPLSNQEKATEIALLKRWGISNEREAAGEGIDWPETKYKDIWSWQDVHESWLKNIEDDYPGVHKLIEATQEIHSDGTAAYLCYMAVRLFEIRRVLKGTGSLYLHCDHTAGAYLRQLLDGIFGTANFRNEIVWRKYAGRKNNAKVKFSTQQDTILFYSKTANSTFNVQYEPISKKEIDNKYKFADENGRLYREAWGRHFQMTGENRRIYLDEQPGAAIGSLWVEDGLQLNTSSAERTGYPTQKPVALAERIIKASSPEGGTVLDCFAGCAYVAVAAERLERNWVACDINPRAWTVFKRQFSKTKLALLKCDEPTHNLQKVLLGSTATVHGPHELPICTTPIDESAPPALKLTDSPRQFKTPASIIPEPEMLEILLSMSGYIAWCCGFANRMPDGSIRKTTRNFHLDHLNPVSKEGTSHQITNRAPLCPYHNIKKSNHRLHLAEYREKIEQDGDLMVYHTSDLIDLNYTAHQTLNIYSARQPQKILFA